VVHASYAEHAHNVQKHADPESCPTKAHEEHEQTPEVDPPEGRLLNDVKEVKRISDSAHEDNFPNYTTGDEERWATGCYDQFTLRHRAPKG
jgi:hypothetical protein